MTKKVSTKSSLAKMLEKAAASEAPKGPLPEVPIEVTENNPYNQLYYTLLKQEKAKELAKSADEAEKQRIVNLLMANFNTPAKKAEPKGDK